VLVGFTTPYATTDVVASSNLDQDIVIFSGSSGFLHQWNWPPRYNLHIVESGESKYRNKRKTQAQKDIHEFVLLPHI
jgi:hypothetical protein